MNTHNRFAASRKQRGYSLLEIIVVIGVIGLMVAAVAWGINKAFGSNDIKDETNNITKVMSAIPDLRSTSGYGTTGSNLVPQLIAQNEIPSTWQVVSGVPKNAWGGDIAVVSKVSYVEISSSNLTVEACNKLAVKLSKGAAFKTTKIGTSGTPITGEVTGAAAQTACAAGATITWATTS